jgi:hypothetical protein
MTSATRSATEQLSKPPHPGAIEFIDVPEEPYLMCDGSGAPGSEAFGHAIQALYSISYGAKFALKKRGVTTSRMGPLEALWDTVAWENARRQSRYASWDSEQWERSWKENPESIHWTAMIMQPPEIDPDVVAEVARDAELRKGIAAASGVVLRRWAEGRCAQLLHVGPYSAEAANISRLHSFIEEHRLRPRGRHHEIYLSDPRRTTEANLRTIIRQPVEEPVQGFADPT